MGKLILQTIEEEKVEEAIAILNSKGLLIEPNFCGLCKKSMGKIGGFMPKNDKIIVVCDDISCIIKASFLIMQFNGNGSPVIEK